MKITKKQLRKLIKERFSSDDFKDVYNTARMAHVGQTRRDGSEYFSHPSEVRNIARGFYPRDNVVQMAALLHDSLEDAPGLTMSSTEEMEDFIRGSIQDQSSANEVIRVVRALTHEKGGSYTDYVLSLLGDIPTLRVKLADMVHNLSDAPSSKQKAKYKTALDAISSQTGGRAPSGISPRHWEKLLSLTEGIRMTENQLRKIIQEVFKSYVLEPNVGDKIVNVNPGCSHFKSKGVVDKINDLPNGKGKTVVYITTNSGENWDVGELLEKTIDQLDFEV